MKIIYALIGSFLVYLSGAFYSAGFNISFWSEDTRFFVALGMLALVALIIMAPKE